MLQDELLNTAQAALYLGVSTSWLAKARMRGKGPLWVRLPPRMVRYRRADLINYIDGQRRRSTSEDAALKARSKPAAAAAL